MIATEQLFINKKIRPHADIDISIFDEDRKKIVEFMLKKGWNIYEHPPYKKWLGLISDPNDERVLYRHCVWAIKPDCSFFRIEPKPGEENIFDYEILNKEQLNFDFIEIIFNTLFLRKQSGFLLISANRRHIKSVKGLEQPSKNQPRGIIRELL